MTPFSVPPVVPWSRGPVWLPSGPVPRPQPGLGWVSQDPESVARGTRSVCPGGPVVPWSRLAPVWLPSTLTPTFTRTLTLTLAFTHTHSHSHTHTLTHSHTHTYSSLSLALFLLFGVHAPVSLKENQGNFAGDKLISVGPPSIPGVHIPSSGLHVSTSPRLYVFTSPRLHVLCESCSTCTHFTQ